MKKIISCIIVLLIVNQIFGQTNVDFINKNFADNPNGLKTAKKQIEEGDKYYLIGRGAYSLAYPFYLKANNFNPNNSKLNFKIALCYLFSDNEPEAIKYFLISKKLQGKEKTTVNYYLAMAYQKDYQTQKAIDTYNEFKNEIPFYKKVKWNKKTDKRIYECETALLLMNEPNENKVSNFGEIINTASSEHSPVLIKDNEIIFTSRKKEGNIAPDLIDSLDFQNYEDIYIYSNKTVSLYNTDMKYSEHDALVALNDNYSILYNSSNGGDLFLKEKSKTEILPKQINSNFHESSAVISKDGNTIYFSTNKKGDNYDIYYSEKNKKGNWKKAEKLSNSVNTKYDEKGLFLHPNGRTLYFASNGHNSMGGYDVFSTTKQSGKNEWSQAQNLGSPINTPDDDMFFVVSPKEKQAFLSSNRKNGYGNMDIYKVDLSDIFFSTTMLKLIVKNEEGKLIDAKIEIMTSDYKSIINSTASKGILETNIYIGNGFNLIANSKNYMFHSQKFDIPKNNETNEVVIEIIMKKVKNGEKVILTDVEFNYASSKLKKSSYKQLDKIAMYLQTNPKMKIEISGHTDNTGDYDDNMKLSEKRAKSVVDYLISKGVSSDNLSHSGYSSDKPIGSNETEEGRKLNRRVEFEIKN